MTQANRPPVAFPYSRFSSKKQERGDSVRRQTALPAEWSAATTVPLDLSLTLRDLGVSAFRGNNRHVGALGKFLAAVEEGVRVKPGDFLIVESLDRLSRQTAYKALPIVTNLVEAGIRIVNLRVGCEPRIIDDEVLTKNPHILIEILLEFARAHEESLVKSQRTKIWRVHRLGVAREKGTAIKQRTPGWIKRVGDKFELIPERAAIVRRILDMALTGMGPVIIAQTLNREGVPPISGRSTTKVWHFAVVRLYCRTRITLGEYQPMEIQEDGSRKPAGNVIKDYYPALIDETAFYRVQAALDVRAKGKGQGREGQNVANLFGRLLVNGFDGTTCYLSEKHGKRRLISAKMVQGLAPMVSFPHAAFEEAFLTWVSEVRLDDGRPISRLPELEARLAEVVAKTEQVQVATDGKAKDFPTLVRMLADLDTQAATISAQIEQERRQEAQPHNDGADVGKLAARMAGLEGAELRETRIRLRQAIASVVERIELYPAVGASQLIRHALVFVVLRGEFFRMFEIRVERGRPTVVGNFTFPLEPITKNDFERRRGICVDLLPSRALAPYSWIGVTLTPGPVISSPPQPQQLDTPEQVIQLAIRRYRRRCLRFGDVYSEPVVELCRIEGEMVTLADSKGVLATYKLKLVIREPPPA